MAQMFPQHSINHKTGHASCLGVLKHGTTGFSIFGQVLNCTGCGEMLPQRPINHRTGQTSCLGVLKHGETAPSIFGQVLNLTGYGDQLYPSRR